MESNPLVSVVVPCYNSESYLTDSLTSILNQSYRNLELILVDDGSSDRTLELMENIKHQDSRVALVRNECNLGTAVSRNVGLTRVHGIFYAPGDHDDIWLPNKLKKQVEFLLNNPGYAAVGCQLEVIDTGSNVVGTRKYYTGFEQIRKSIIVTSPICNPASLIRVEHFKNVGFYYDHQISGTEDYDLWFRLIGKYKLANLSDHLYQYRTYSGQQTARKTKKVLLMSQQVQRKWMFKQKGFPLEALLVHIIKYTLLLLPDPVIVKLNYWVNYSKERHAKIGILPS